MERLYIIRPLEGGRIGGGGLTHAAPKLGDRLVFVLRQPRAKAVEDAPQVKSPVAEQGGGHHGDVSPDKQCFDHVVASVHS